MHPEHTTAAGNVRELRSLAKHFVPFADGPVFR
jgi:hypothetical protein